MCGIYSFAHLSKDLSANEVEKVANHETNQQSIGLWTQSLCLCQRPWCFPEVGGWPVFCPTYSTLPAKPVVKHLFFKLPLPPPPAGCLSGLQQFFSINFSSFSKSDLTFDCRSLMNIILRAIWFINYIPAKPVVESILGSRRCISNFPPISGCCLPVQASLARIPIQLGCQVKKNTACKDSCHTTLLAGTNHIIVFRSMFIV